MGREENVLVFEDTVERCRDNLRLMESIRASRDGQHLVLEGDCVPCGRDRPRFSRPARLALTGHRTFEAAEKYVRSQDFADSKVCVLNFASSMNPGGGVVHGAGAQEECLCRCSTLYFCLDDRAMWDNFYLPHRSGLSSLHNDDLIYTPDVTVFKSDTLRPKPLEEGDWYQVDVISCAAPNLHRYFGSLMRDLGEKEFSGIDDGELAAIHRRRVARILDVAAQNQADVLVLGAFGCGAFMNNPHVVATVMVQLARDYGRCFKAIEFAVYCPLGDMENYRAFERALASVGPQA